MRWFCLSLLLLAACGPSQIEQTRLKDGSLKVTCQLSMDECLRRIQDQCPNQRYRILEGVSETRLRDAPPFERQYHTSHVTMMCSNDGASVLLSPEEAHENEALRKGGERKCSTGETRACVGAGACKGGQACLPDGSGFGACDCGPAPAPVAPTPPAPPEPAAPAPTDAAPADPAPTMTPAPAAP